MHLHAMAKRMIRCAALGAGILILGSVRAEPGQTFTPERLSALQRDGETILVEIYADWCPVCKAQEQVLEELHANGELDGIRWLKLDWDTQRESAKALGAWRQSTFVLFRGERMVGRLVAQTDRAVIASFLRKADDD